MELIKKQVQRITTTATTTCDEGVEGPCFRIIPDTTVNYNFKILLKSKVIDYGFFDVTTDFNSGGAQTTAASAD